MASFEKIWLDSFPVRYVSVLSKMLGKLWVDNSRLSVYTCHVVSRFNKQRWG